MICNNLKTVDHDLLFIDQLSGHNLFQLKATNNPVDPHFSETQGKEHSKTVTV